MPAERALDLDALQQLCDAATPRPWVYSELLASIGGRDGAPVCVMSASRLDEAADEQNPQAAWDGEFIEAARDALPKLIAEVRRLQGALQLPVCLECCDKLCGSHCRLCGAAFDQDEGP
jgi:hypothetical protein